MKCHHCEEEITPEELEMIRRRWPDARLHPECAIRAVLGSAAHQLGVCSCFGGVGHDPPELTLREAARLAFDAFLENLKETQRTAMPPFPPWRH